MLSCNFYHFIRLSFGISLNTISIMYSVGTDNRESVLNTNMSSWCFLLIHL